MIKMRRSCGNMNLKRAILFICLLSVFLFNGCHNKKDITVEIPAVTGSFDFTVLKNAKQMGFSDKFIAKLWNCDEISVYEFRKEILKFFRKIFRKEK